MFDWFNELPKETRTMIALAGLGTPLGLIWLVKRYVLPDVATVWIILGAAGLLALVALVVFALKGVFTDDRR